MFSFAYGVFAAFYDRTVVLFIKIVKPLFKSAFCFQPFHAHDRVFRDEYIYRRELLWPSCLSIHSRKSYLNWNSVVRKILSKSPVEIMHASVGLFEWLTLCEGVGNACAAMALLSSVVFRLL